MPVYLIGTLDTKGQEVAFVRDELHAFGVDVVVVDGSCLDEPTIVADVTREEWSSRRPARRLAAVRAANDRGHAVTTAAQGVSAADRATSWEGTRSRV